MQNGRSPPYLRSLHNFSRHNGIKTFRSIPKVLLIAYLRDFYFKFDIMVVWMECFVNILSKHKFTKIWILFQKIFQPIVSQSGFQQLPCSRAIAWLYNTYALLFIQSIFQSPILHIWPCKSKPYSGMSSTKNNQRLCMHKMYHCLQKLALAFYLFLSLLTTWAQIFWKKSSHLSQNFSHQGNWHKNINQ